MANRYRVVWESGCNWLDREFDNATEAEAFCRVLADAGVSSRFIEQRDADGIWRAWP